MAEEQQNKISLKTDEESIKELMDTIQRDEDFQLYQRVKRGINLEENLHGLNSALVQKQENENQQNN